jgi:hypothetical protein
MIERHIGDFQQRSRSRKKPQKQKPALEKKYPEGHFVQPVIAWFGAMWRPRWPSLVGRYVNIASIAAREQLVADGIGWGGGTVRMANTPNNARPGWME